jgi:LacI family transcriptional regulator
LRIAFPQWVSHAYQCMNPQNGSPTVVTMADVARRAGVHQTTVSRALRGDAALPAATRERLVALADRMGYRRNPLVAALISQRRRGRPVSRGAVLGILAAGPRPDGWRRGSGTYQRLHEGLVARANRLGYGLQEFALDEPGVRPERLRRILRARGIHGLLLAPMPLERETVEFDFTDFAAVALRLRLRTPALDRVSPDYFLAMFEALERLRAAGHCRVAFLSDLRVDERVRHRSLAAYLAARHADPARLLPPWIVERWEKRAFGKWVRHSRPDAIITPVESDYSRVAAWLQEAGWSLPQHVSLLTLDAHRETRSAGIVHNLDLEAASALNLLARKVEGAEFGIPEFPCRTAIPGLWRRGEFFAPRN